MSTIKSKRLFRLKKNKATRVLNCNRVIKKLPVTTYLPSLVADESMDCAGQVSH